MARSATRSVALRAGFDEVFNFLSDPQNLHLWTVDFATAPPEKSGDVFKVTTPRGMLDVYVRGDRETGVIDFFFGRDGQFRSSPSRLLRDGDGVAYVFTQFEPAGAPEGLFERLVGNVEKELDILAERFGGARI